MGDGEDGDGGGGMGDGEDGDGGGGMGDGEDSPLIPLSSSLIPCSSAKSDG